MTSRDWCSWYTNSASSPSLPSCLDSPRPTAMSLSTSLTNSPSHCNDLLSKSPDKVTFMSQLLSKHMDNKEKFLRVSFTFTFFAKFIWFFEELHLRAEKQRNFLEIRQPLFATAVATSWRLFRAVGRVQNQGFSRPPAQQRKQDFAFVDAEKTPFGPVPRVCAFGSQCSKSKCVFKVGVLL